VLGATFHIVYYNHIIVVCANRHAGLSGGSEVEVPLKLFHGLGHDDCNELFLLRPGWCVETGRLVRGHARQLTSVICCIVAECFGRVHDGLCVPTHEWPLAALGLKCGLA